MYIQHDFLWYNQNYFFVIHPTGFLLCDTFNMIFRIHPACFFMAYPKMCFCGTSKSFFFRHGNGEKYTHGGGVSQDKRLLQREAWSRVSGEVNTELMF